MVAYSRYRRIAGVALLAWLAAPSLALADFGTRFPMSPPGAPAGYPQVAADFDGDALVAWEQRDTAGILRIVARARSKTGVLGPLQVLSVPGDHGFRPQVAMDADGDALVAWHSYSETKIRARARSKTGALGPIQTFSGSTATFPQVAMDSEGDALVVWQHCDIALCRIQARARSRNGVLGPIKNISPASDTVLPSYRVAMDADGDALIIWPHPDGDFRRLKARAWSKAGDLGLIQTISPAGRNAEVPSVAMDADGDALIVWNEGFSRILSRWRTNAGVLGQIQVLATANVLEPQVNEPQVAIEPDGDAVVVWQQTGERSRIKGRTRSAAGALGPIRILSAASGNANAPQVAVEPLGNAVVVWNFVGDTNRRIQARTLSATGVLGPLQTLATTNSSSQREVDRPQVAMDREGDALAVWPREVTSSVDRIEAAAGP